MLLLNYPNVNSYESMRRNTLSDKQINNFKKSLLKIARDNCPKDTTNMAENAIYAISNQFGFSIIWDDKFAYYLPYVDKGINPINPNSAKVKANKGFVARSIAFMQAYTGLFLYGQTNKIKENYGEDVSKFYNRYFYYGNVKNPAKKSFVRDSPYFVNLMYYSMNGKLQQYIIKEKGAMMANLIKSLKRNIKSREDVEEIMDFANDFKEYKMF